MEVLALGDLSRHRAHWVSRNVIVWRASGDGVVRLHGAADGGMALAKDGITGADRTYELSALGPLSADLAAPSEFASTFHDLR